MIMEHEEKQVRRETRKVVTVCGLFVATVGSLVLDWIALGIGQDLVMRRERTCNGALPMPTLAFTCTWIGAVLAVGVLIFAALTSRRRKRSDIYNAVTGLYTATAWFAVFATLAAAFALHAVYADAPLTPSQCSG